MSTYTIHSLPSEVIERVLTSSDPRDVSRYARTCKYAHNLVYTPHDQYLWRELYLGLQYDDLRNAPPLPKGQYTTANPISHAELQAHEDSEGSQPKIPWRTELQRRTQAELIAASGTRDVALLEAAYETFLSAIATAIPVGHNEAEAEKKDGGVSEGAPSHSENLRWLDRILRETRVLDIVPEYTDGLAKPESTNTNTAASNPFLGIGPSDSTILSHALAQSTCSAPPKCQKVAQMRAQLRAFAALSHEDSFGVSSRGRMAALRKASRAFVYDMRKYQPSTLWGPFRTAIDGRTVLANWEHVEHILNVVGLKLREIPIASLGFHKKPLFRMDALRANSAVGASERPEGDWAGVTGTWRRFVCFMDYRDLYMFNVSGSPAGASRHAHPHLTRPQYSLLPPGPHDPNFFDESFGEALRPVELELSLISREDYFSEPHRIALDPSTNASRPASRGGPVGDCEDPAFPTLYFKGYSRGGLHSTDASIRGKVSTLSDGAVRWQFVTTYDGRMQWSAEAVQVGHVCSAAGVAGIWTGAHHDRDDPAGPFWMVKVDDTLPTSILNTLH
ncbi:hypothetical protein C8Q80DRAFT_1133267 [Daedaleopsis nitida]|nr:hypothetical protein C8Q80DRAFT_1133267 [Daedaleopsis nitida]